MLTTASILAPVLVASIVSLPNSTLGASTTLDYFDEVTKKSSNMDICSPPRIGAISKPAMAISLHDAGLLIESSEIPEE